MEKIAHAEIEGGGTTWWFVCSECHVPINYAENVCRCCGRRIIWEDAEKRRRYTGEHTEQVE